MPMSPRPELMMPCVPRIVVKAKRRTMIDTQKGISTATIISDDSERDRREMM